MLIPPPSELLCAWPGPTSHPSRWLPGLTSWDWRRWRKSTRAPCFQNQMEATPVCEERSSASSPLPPAEEISSSETEPEPARTVLAARSGIHRSWAGEACGPAVCVGEGACGEEMAQTRYRLVCFPCEEKRALCLFFWDQADIFNPSSFLPPTGVSSGVTVRRTEP